MCMAFMADAVVLNLMAASSTVWYWTQPNVYGCYSGAVVLNLMAASSTVWYWTQP